MATATATAIPTVAPAPPPVKGRKKLFIIVACAVLALAVAGGGATWLLMKKKSAHVDAEGEDPAANAQAAPPHKESHGAPIFVPLDTFTVNLADREAERYAQIGITLEIEDSKVGDQIKTFMPAIRNNILMTIADRTAGDLLGREGKIELAERVRRETSRALGFELDAAGDKPGKKPGKGDSSMPVRAVHFSNFIIQ